ncbi:hypothetical protein AWH56_009060 [Anaerobacillus isosaccharinicus]|uniref:Uncharacterized protein n=1 Tax=Anaerobacillus isosaccharinicus TaxID=1532552 RepID=A0A1S2MD84_9BACI|nr:hypothetical protein [Anaerobacillus isosaccharinicus]MBA5588901.1 hypothetical protein [Anaerobacillus isosaccharinicus]QOY37711.1 hypothetical protein AWH56_009060 [Anaerobacillus isosaccharinicus]
MITTFAVNQKFPLYDKLPSKDYDNSALNYNPDGSLFVTIAWNNLSFVEESMVTTEEVRFRYLKEDDYMLLMIKFGDLSPLEFPFDPTLYAKQNIKFYINTNRFEIFLVELETGNLKGMRLLGLHPDFINHFVSHWQRNMEIPTFTVEYGNWISRIRSFYTVDEIWDRSTDIDWK